MLCLFLQHKCRVTLSLTRTPVDGQFSIETETHSFCAIGLLGVYQSAILHQTLCILTHSHNPLTFDVCRRYKSKTPVVPLNV